MPYNIKGECRNTGRTHFKVGSLSYWKGKTKPAWVCENIKAGISKTNRISPFLGRNHSEETIAKIKAARAIQKNIPSNKGKSWSEARREAQKLVTLKPREKRPKNKPVLVGGKPYNPNWNEIRKYIYQRDNWTCQECGVHCKEKTNRVASIRIQCHHIDVDTTNNDFSNLITLCASCHTKVHMTKKDWINHFKLKME